MECEKWQLYFNFQFSSSSALNGKQITNARTCFPHFLVIPGVGRMGGPTVHRPIIHGSVHYCQRKPKNRKNGVGLGTRLCMFVCCLLLLALTVNLKSADFTSTCTIIFKFQRTLRHSSRLGESCRTVYLFDKTETTREPTYSLARAP